MKKEIGSVLKRSFFKTRLIIVIITFLVLASRGVHAISNAEVKVFLPAVVKTFNQFIMEAEPNSTFETANVLTSQMAFYGYANDGFDFIVFDHFPSGPLMITLENPAPGAQFAVYFSDKQTQVANTYIWKEPYQLSKTSLNAGLYYLRLHTPDTGINFSWLYKLYISFMSYHPYPVTPQDEAIQVPVETQLKWGGVNSSGEAVVYDVFLEAGDSTPDVKVSSNQTGAIYNPGGLLPGAVYYWQVVAQDVRTGVIRQGPVWSFTTGEAPGEFSKISPSEGSIVSLSPVLSWGASSNATGYEYCFDTSNDNACGSWMATTNTTVTLNDLTPNTVYYWHVRARNNFGITYSSGNSSAFVRFETVNFEMFGDGRDGDLTVSNGQTMVINTTMTNIDASSINASVTDSSGFSVGDIVLIHQSQGPANVGKWEFNTISVISGTSWTLGKPLSNHYTNTSGKAQVIKVPQYHHITVQSDGTLTAPAWNGSKGGILVFFANGTINIQSSGKILMSGKGYRGAPTNTTNYGGQQGEGQPSYGGQGCSLNGTGGGGGGSDGYGSPPGGAGGGNGTAGNPGGVGYNAGGACISNGGEMGGTEDLTEAVFGGGGGSGGDKTDSGTYAGGGGSGGGLIIAHANNLTIYGTMENNGIGGFSGNGTGGGSNGGGGAGGSILIRSSVANIGTGLIAANFGTGFVIYPDQGGGDGGYGRIRIEYCDSLSGVSSPTASILKRDCILTRDHQSSGFFMTRENPGPAILTEINLPARKRNEQSTGFYKV